MERGCARQDPSTEGQRWIKYDDNFRAARASYGLEMFDASRRTLERLVQAAVNCVLHHVMEGDVKVAIQVLKGHGLLDGQLPHFQSEDPRQHTLQRARHTNRMEKILQTAGA